MDRGGNRLSDHLSKYFEVDFPEITMKKAMLIKKRRELCSLLDDPSNVKIERGGMDLKGPDYCMLGGDLRNWTDITTRLVDAGLDLK